MWTLILAGSIRLECFSDCLPADQGRQKILQFQISAVTSSVYDDFALRHLHCMLVGLAPKFEFEESEFRVHTLRAEEWIKAFSQA